MPISRAESKTQPELFELATVSSRQTGIKAINELLSAGEIERIVKGGKAMNTAISSGNALAIGRLARIKRSQQF